MWCLCHVASNEESSQEEAARQALWGASGEQLACTLKMTQIVGSTPQSSREIDIRALLTSRGGWACWWAHSRERQQRPLVGTQLGGCPGTAGAQSAHTHPHPHTLQCILGWGVVYSLVGTIWRFQAVPRHWSAFKSREQWVMQAETEPGGAREWL